MPSKFKSNTVVKKKEFKKKQNKEIIKRKWRIHIIDGVWVVSFYYLINLFSSFLFLFWQVKAVFFSFDLLFKNDGGGGPVHKIASNKIF